MPKSDQDNVTETIMDDDLDLMGDESLGDDTPRDFSEYKRDENDRIIVPLKHPVKTNKRTYESVAMRPPLGGDLRIAGNAKNDTDNGLILLQRCCEGLTPEAVNKMRSGDIKELSAVLNFLSDQ